MSEDCYRHCTFETAAGWCGVAWSGAGVVGFQLPASSRAAAERLLVRRLGLQADAGEPPSDVATAIAAAQRYFNRERQDFSGVRLALARIDPLAKRIYEALRHVGWGETVTYGDLARAIGEGPEAARDVGQAMARNPAPLIIPCHRVLAAGGKLGGFSAPGGAETKRRMLAIEGVDLAPPPSSQQSFAF